MKKNKLDVGSKLTLYILATCILSFGLLGIICYLTVGQVLTNQCKKDAMEFASFAASEIDGDKFDSINSVEDEAYSEIYNTLAKYKRSNLVTYIYAMRLDSDYVLRFVVDTDDETPAEIGEEYEYIKSMQPAFDGEVCCDAEARSDRWGTLLSAYAPIYTKNNEIAGIVGCDIKITDINKIKRNLANIIIVIISIFCAAYFILYNRISAKMVSMDYLTEISNYDGLINKGHQLEKSGRISEYDAVLINIKDFKYLNQKIGMNLGDTILRKYAKLLKSFIGKKEFIARTGSDNFMVLVMKDNTDEFLHKISDIQLKLTESDDSFTAINARCGIYPIKENNSIKEIMNSASMALKEARLSSSPDFVWFKDDMISNMVEEKKLLIDYRKAIENKEFIVYYQPKVNAENYKLCGAEALVRWIKEGKLIPPNKFIPVLEKERLIAELDFYVFETVCMNISEWQKNGIEPCRISSNFSKIHLTNQNFADDVISIVRKYNISHEYIEIELTESSGYSDFDALTRFVERMNEEAINTSIDDFGTGYSSLSLLKDINVDVVKIDKSFLAKTQSEDVKQEKMLENIIHMINDLDRTVICEGVETEEQLNFLKNADCNIIQGYFFDKPLPHDEFEKRLKNPDYRKNISK